MQGTSPCQQERPLLQDRLQNARTLNRHPRNRFSLAQPEVEGEASGAGLPLRRLVLADGSACAPAVPRAAGSIRSSGPARGCRPPASVAVGSAAVGSAARSRRRQSGSGRFPEPDRQHPIASTRPATVDPAALDPAAVGPAVSDPRPRDRFREDAGERCGGGIGGAHLPGATPACTPPAAVVPAAGRSGARTST